MSARDAVEDCSNKAGKEEKVGEDVAPAGGGAQVSSLKDICFEFLRRHAKQLESMLLSFLRHPPRMLLDSSLLAKALLSAVNFLSAATIRRIERIFPALGEEDDYEAVWRCMVRRQYSTREISSPFPEMVEEVKRFTTTLEDESTSPSDITKCLSSLDLIPFSEELAKQTNVGLAVSKLRKRSTLPTSVLDAAKDLSLKWKKIYKYQNGETNGFHILGESGLASVQLHSWKELYDHYEKKEKDMIEAGAKKFNKLSSAEREKRKKSISSDSKDVSTRKQRRISKFSDRSSPSFRPAVKTSKGMSAVDVRRARNMESTKKLKVIQTSSGGVMQIPHSVFNKSLK